MIRKQKYFTQGIKRVFQGFWETREHWQTIEGNKETLAHFWEQGNKIRKITVRKHGERVWEHGNIGQFWKGTRGQGPPWETLNKYSRFLLLRKLIIQAVLGKLDNQIQNVFFPSSVFVGFSPI